MTDQQAPELKTKTSFDIYFNEAHKVEQLGYKPNTKDEWATLSSVQAREKWIISEIEKCFIDTNDHPTTDMEIRLRALCVKLNNRDKND